MANMHVFSVGEDFSCFCFVRENTGPLFAVREFDAKVIRSPSKLKKGRGPSEQAIRASIRQVILNMNLKSERATKAEIKALKAHGVLGKRAPSCSLLHGEDMIKLLQAFGKDTEVENLRLALQNDPKLRSIGSPSLTSDSDAPSPSLLDSPVSPNPQHLFQTVFSTSLQLTHLSTSSTAPLSRKRALSEGDSSESLKKRATSSTPTGLDALLSALQTMNNSL